MKFRRSPTHPDVFAVFDGPQDATHLGDVLRVRRGRVTVGWRVITVAATSQRPARAPARFRFPTKTAIGDWLRAAANPEGTRP